MSLSPALGEVPISIMAMHFGRERMEEKKRRKWEMVINFVID